MDCIYVAQRASTARSTQNALQCMCVINHIHAVYIPACIHMH